MFYYVIILEKLMTISIRYKLILLTPLFILLAHHLAVFPHEYAHSFMAWLLGYKDNPIAIDYGRMSWLNLLLLFHIDEHVNYGLIVAQGHLQHMALIAVAGPGIANGLLYLWSLYLLTKDSIKKNILLYYFIFWFNFMNLANFYDYVPIRTFASHGDVGHIAMGLSMSPWWIYIFIGYLVAFVIWYFFTHTLIKVFIQLRLTTTITRASLMSLCVLLLFGYFGIAGYLGYGEISHFLSATSFVMIPGAIIVCWPTRGWVKRQLEALT